MQTRRKHLKILIPLLVAVVFCIAFFSGTDASKNAAPTDTGQSTVSSAAPTQNVTQSGIVTDAALQADTDEIPYNTDAVPEGKPLPVEPQDISIGNTSYTCTISISCATILNNMDICDPEKAELVPSDGWILKPSKVSFNEGESVFDLLQRICMENKIHMEFKITPIYNSAYIEGINNIYEFDAGSLSGWMYKVNNWFPNYGCSRYQLHDGDEVCWVYTCDLGKDVGGGVTGNQ